jgi:hypothetical protein
MGLLPVTSAVFLMLNNFGKSWASRRNIWDVSATPTRIKRRWYVCMYVTSDPPRLHTCAMLIQKCFSIILCILYSYKPSPWISLLKKQQQNPLGSFKDLSIQRDWSRKRLCFILCYDEYDNIHVYLNRTRDQAKSIFYVLGWAYYWHCRHHNW